MLESVLEKAAPAKPGFASWDKRLPPEAQAELDKVRRAFNPHIHQKRAYARAVIEAAAELGWETAGLQGVIAWLSRKH